MQKQRFNKVQDSPEEAINEMKRTRELLKKIADMAGDDEVYFRLHEISSSLEVVSCS
jgi:tRNA G26 N,N-dimethylase Trm1